ncbi:hypothetical protein CHH80_00160 [Bacillus sp. 7504-2]|nr:hypothetical protein CHH80_00160 [Bacillus sp. 7504-2]
MRQKGKDSNDIIYRATFFIAIAIFLFPLISVIGIRSEGISIIDVHPYLWIGIFNCLYNVICVRALQLSSTDFAQSSEGWASLSVMGEQALIFPSICIFLPKLGILIITD